ncbi:hypothetical protein SAM23877_5318 [Streptomyces ambofaciens ATCC 23877]|uniref:Uncharacterized protein n=1 Tax=Streptomyces ambofaciens (strain ATCC 23877 / 3486 / DSM 40053 / JCM 4204 / NBRC 12836 / NRRL B-2516) TaxID=278992 RepID=A0A0K2AZG8_STRA7|nr:hypothetical protein SAM23877_5318 [Streptomyces ambofaciens ATCC 23877]
MRPASRPGRGGRAGRPEGGRGSAVAAGPRPVRERQKAGPHEVDRLCAADQAVAARSAVTRQRETFPALMHEVQAFTRFGVPPTTVRTRWMFGFQRRGVRR